MNDVTNHKRTRVRRRRRAHGATDERIDPVLDDGVPAVDDNPSPAISLAGLETAGNIRKEPTAFVPQTLSAPVDTQQHALRISRALKRLFEPTDKQAATSETIVEDPHFKTLSMLFPIVDDNAGRGEVILRNDTSALTVVPAKISFSPVAGPDGLEDIKKAFTAESAYAMALIASKNKNMLEKGVRLSGPKEQQDMLRAAIERVNEALPDGQKLRIREPKVAAKPTQDFEAAHAAPVKAPLPTRQAQTVVAAPPEQPARPDGPAAHAVPPQSPKASSPVPVKRTVPPNKKPLLAGAATGALAALFLINSTDAVNAHYKFPQDGELTRGAANVAFEPVNQPKDLRQISLPPLTNFATTTGRMAQDAPPEPPVQMASIDRGRTLDKFLSMPDQTFRAPTAGQLTIVRQNGASSMTLDLAHFNTPGRSDAALAHYRSEFNVLASDVRKGVVKDMDPALLNNLIKIVGKLRDMGYEADQIVINSGYRTHETNRHVGGARNSQHLHADAIDFSVTGVPVKVLYDACVEVVGTEGGLGRYATYVHMDTRTSFARWGRPAPRAS